MSPASQNATARAIWFSLWCAVFLGMAVWIAHAASDSFGAERIVLAGLAGMACLLAAGGACSAVVAARGPRS